VNPLPFLFLKRWNNMKVAMEKRDKIVLITLLVILFLAAFSGIGNTNKETKKFKYTEYVVTDHHGVVMIV